MENSNKKYYDLSKFSNKIKNLTDNNYHSEARLLIAKLIGNKKFYKLVKATNYIIDYEKSNVIVNYTDTLYSIMDKLGRKKYGVENWNKHVRSNL